MKQQTGSSIIQWLNNVFVIIQTEVGMKDSETERELSVNGSRNSRAREPDVGHSLINELVRVHVRHKR